MSNLYSMASSGPAQINLMLLVLSDRNNNASWSPEPRAGSHRMGKAPFLEGKHSLPPLHIKSFGPALITQRWSCREEENKEPGGEKGVKRLGWGRVSLLITSLVITESGCVIMLRFHHSRVGTTCRELSEVETMGMTWDSAPARGGYSMSVTNLYSSASMGYRHLSPLRCFCYTAKDRISSEGSAVVKERPVHLKRVRSGRLADPRED